MDAATRFETRAVGALPVIARGAAGAAGGTGGVRPGSAVAEWRRGRVPRWPCPPRPCGGSVLL